MNFFRLRFINTLLLFIAGLILGFILKEKFYPKTPDAQPAAQADFQRSPAQPAETPAETPDEDLRDEPYTETEEQPEPYQGSGHEVLPSPRAEEAPGLVIEPQQPKAPPRAARADDADAFFGQTAQYAGRDVELNLQMITAKRGQSGWRLNLVYSGPNKKVDYLYVQDSQLLGEKPDLRIGYSYKVRFTCGKGDPASGNTLLAIEPTGEKAAWATGLSAIE